ncbi:unnamed protein product, partial [Mesorhabditis spiculigera]
MMDLAKVPPSRRLHFLEYVDRGKSTALKIKFLVMELVSLCLEDIRRLVLPDHKFTLCTLMQIAKQSLQAIWDLHDVGYIHRDVSTRNFAVGLGEKDRTVYMLDFGTARRWTETSPSGKVTARRERRGPVDGIGAVTYRSRNCFKLKELSRRDDVESWLYFLFELWTERWCPGPNVLVAREQVFKKEWWLPGFPPEFYQVCQWLDLLQYEDQPPYQKIMDHVDHVAAVHKLNLNDKLDWEGKITDDHRFGLIKSQAKLLAERDEREKKAAQDREKRKEELEKAKEEEKKKKEDEEKKRKENEAKNRKDDDAKKEEPAKRKPKPEGRGIKTDVTEATENQDNDDQLPKVSKKKRMSRRSR